VTSKNVSLQLWNVSSLTPTLKSHGEQIAEDYGNLKTKKQDRKITQPKVKISCTE
jgi:hypothetical protein